MKNDACHNYHLAKQDFIEKFKEFTSRLPY